jgi:hypothetical protein
VLTDHQRLALKLLADSANGCTVLTMLTQGCAIGMLHGLVRTGLATAHREREHPRQRKIIRLRITDAGRRAIGTQP